MVECSTMTVCERISKTKLKIKFSSKRVEAEPEKKTFEHGQNVFTNNECNNIIVNRDGKYDTHNLQTSVIRPFHGKKLLASDSLKLKLPFIRKKCGDEETFDCFTKKRQKVDHNVTVRCSGILKFLMEHEYGWPFKEPVDPVVLNIPDYFTIVSNPMDLGTVKHKLETNSYKSIEEFAADVRLTFSNALLYNPPANHVHLMAKRLSDIFNKKWKLLQGKCCNESISNPNGCNANRSLKRSEETGHACHKKSNCFVNQGPNMTISPKEKQKLKKELIEVSKQKVTGKLQRFLEKIDVMSTERRKIELVDMDVFDDETLMELKRLVKDFLDARALKMESSKVTQNGNRLLFVKNNKKGTDSASGSSCSPGKVTPSVASSCASDLSSERSHAQDQVTYKVDFEEKGIFAFDLTEDDVGKEKTCTSPQLSTSNAIATSGEDIHVRLSPKKALRVAMLKSRFASTILKAQQKALLDSGDEPDPVKMQQERERLERQQREEKARIEAQIRAAEASDRRKVEAELKMQREKEREAARIALEKMERTVNLYEFQDIRKDLQIFNLEAYSSAIYDCVTSSKGGSEVLRAFGVYQSRKVLERLGLYIKDDCLDIDYKDEPAPEALHSVGEEGEII